MTPNHTRPPLADVALPDTFGSMAEWLDAQPPRRTPQKVAFALAFAVALAACTVPIHVETELGHAISWTAEGSLAETARQSSAVIGWVGDQPLLGFRVERTGPSSFAYRLAVADASVAQATVWQGRLTGLRGVRETRVEPHVEERRQTLIAATADRLGLFPVGRQVPVPAEYRHMPFPAEFLARYNEATRAHGYQIEMAESLPPLLGSDEPRFRVRMRMPDGTTETREI